MFSLRPLPTTLTGKEIFYLVATWFHAGRIRPVSGTWGSLAAWPFCWILKALGGNPLICIAIVGVFLAGLWAIRQYTPHSKQTDPSEVVVDEVVGMMVVWLAIPAGHFGLALCGFILFRLFDAIKRGPVGWCDRRIKGPMGIMVDDVIAGLMAAAVIGVVRLILI